MNIDRLERAIAFRLWGSIALLVKGRSYFGKSVKRRSPLGIS
ncbi:hypothetical protein [uncultured Nostoc sp.]